MNIGTLTGFVGWDDRMAPLSKAHRDFTLDRSPGQRVPIINQDAAVHQLAMIDTWLEFPTRAAALVARSTADQMAEQGDVVRLTEPGGDRYLVRPLRVESMVYDLVGGGASLRLIWTLLPYEGPT
jgi:hypothetical protein